VLGGGDEDALAHEAGGVADFGDVPAGGGDFEIVEIGAPEDDSAAGRRWKKPHVNRGAAVETDAGELHGGRNGIFQMR